MEIGNLPNKEYRVMIVKMTKELGRRMDVHSEKLEVFNRVRKYKKQPNRDRIQYLKLEKKKRTQEGINNKLNNTEGWITELKTE